MFAPPPDLADVAQRQLQQARGAHHRVADRVLGMADAPDQRARAVLGHRLGDLVAGGLVDAGGLEHLVGRPLGQHFVANLVHAPDAVLEVLLVFPAVLEDVVHHAEEERNVRAGAHADVLVGLGGRSSESWIDHDHLAALFLGMQHVHQGDGVCLGRIAADVHRRLGVLHVVVRVGHRTVSPRIRHTGDSSGVAYSCLVVAVVTAPEGHPLSEQVPLLVVALARADDEDAVRAAFLAQLEHPGADLVERRVPRDALVLAVDQLHRVLEAELAARVVAHRSALGAVRAQVDRRVEHRLLPRPHAVLDHGIDRATHRAVRADRALDLDLDIAAGSRRLVLRVGLAHQRQLRRGNADAHTKTGATQELAPVHRGYRARDAACEAVDQRAGRWRCRPPAASRPSCQQHGVASGWTKLELRFGCCCSTASRAR